MAEKTAKKPHWRFEALLAQAKKEWGRGAQGKIADVLKVSNQTVTNWKQGVHEPSDLELDALSRALGNDKYAEKEPRPIIMHDPPDLMRLVHRMRFALAPVIAYARGGEGSYPVDMEHVSPKIAVPCSDPNCYVLELDGDSMEPLFNAGDLLVVAPNTPPINNDLVIVKTVEEEVFFKILKHPKRGEVFEFHSYNPRHPPMHLRPDQIYRVSVVDTVIKPIKRKWKAMTVSESAVL